MRFQLTVNGLDISSYIKEGGVDISYVTRNERNVVTMDGVRHYAAREKLRMSVSLLDNMFDSDYNDVAEVLKTSPAAISYTDFDSEATISGNFYVFDRKHRPFRSFAGITLINDGGFVLEEVGTE